MLTVMMGLRYGQARWLCHLFSFTEISCWCSWLCYSVLCMGVCPLSRSDQLNRVLTGTGYDWSFGELSADGYHCWLLTKGHFKVGLGSSDYSAMSVSHLRRKFRTESDLRYHL